MEISNFFRSRYKVQLIQMSGVNTPRNQYDAEYLKRSKREKEENDLVARLLKPYSTFLVRYSYVMVAIVVVLTFFSLILSIVEGTGAKAYPDFGNPTKGFRARGTMMSSREMALRNLKRAHDNKLLIPNNATDYLFNERRSRSIEDAPAGLSFHSNYFKLHDHINEFVLFYEHRDGGNLFDHMKDLCLLYNTLIMKSPRYDDNIATYRSKVHHIPNYIALLSNRETCDSITASDVKQFIYLLNACVDYYRNETYFDCRSNYLECSRISRTCIFHSNVPHPQDMAELFYNVFHYLADATLADNPSFLKTTASFDVIGKWHGIEEDFFRPLYDKTLNNLDNAHYNEVKIVAYNMGEFRFHIFETQLILQSLLAVTAIILVIVFIWLYSGSLFVALMTLGCVLIALIISYFVYGRIFNMDFFPFLNMVTSVFIIGIGADDAFVYVGIWEEAKEIYKLENIKEYENYLIKWTTHSLRHAVIAMLVTSLTTAAAFLANISSNVTSVKCFGLYAGTSIILTYMLMITLFPAVVILHERYFAKCMHKCCPSLCKPSEPLQDNLNNIKNLKNVYADNDMPKFSNMSNDRVNSIYVNYGNIQNEPRAETRTTIIEKKETFEELLNYYIHLFFNYHLPKIIRDYKYVFIGVFSVIGVTGVITTFGKPGLKPPSTSDFQMFTSSSSMEQYILKYKRKFAYGMGYTRSERSVDFVFGVKAKDNGNKFNPDDLGSLQLNQVLDIASTQKWLRQFCENIRRAPFYVRSKSCSSIEDLFWYLTHPCKFRDDICCNKKLPIPAKEFMHCFKESLKLVAGGAYSIYRPLFDQNGNFRTLVIPVKTNLQYSDDFKYNKEIIDSLEKWTTEQMKNVTSESFRGWWHTPLPFYDLQNSLFEGTKTSLGIAIAVAFIVILLTSLNVLLSIYSIITIAFIISVTVGSLVLDGWVLNIMESTVFSVAAGLSADFTLHYSVAYRTSLFKSERDVRVKYAISHIGPAIFMGAITTFIAGLVMIPSSVLVYIQMAEFLMLVMFISWLYSTFFFLPLCAAVGPTNYIGQLNVKKYFGKKKEQPSYQSNPTEVNISARPRVTNTRPHIDEVVYDETPNDVIYDEAQREGEVIYDKDGNEVLYEPKSRGSDVIYDIPCGYDT